MIDIKSRLSRYSNRILVAGAIAWALLAGVVLLGRELSWLSSSLRSTIFLTLLLLLVMAALWKCSIAMLAGQAELTQRLDALHIGQTTQAGQLAEVTGEIPSIARTAGVAELARLMEASDRDRDLQIASLHDAVDRARADAATELQASMKWVLDRFRDLGIKP
jgi:hypothetical protein